MKQFGRELLVPIGIDSGADLDVLADDAFHREIAARDMRGNSFDNEPGGCRGGARTGIIVHDRYAYRSRPIGAEQSHLARFERNAPHRGIKRCER